MSELLRCPESGQELMIHDRAEAEALAGGALRSREGAPFADAAQVLLRADHTAAYPLVDGIPILMTPEQLALDVVERDLTDSRWAEAYQEMAFYSYAATLGPDEFEDLAVEIQRRAGMLWPAGWLDAAYDAAAQLDAMEHLGHPAGQVALQLGGAGRQAMMCLLAGAAQVWLVTPMISEAKLATAMAARLDATDRFRAVVAVAEEIPIGDGVFDSIYSAGCLHHMDTKHAGGEILRVLKPHGRFAAIDPWRTVLHKYGTRVLGKREVGVNCSPLNPERLAPLAAIFPTLELRHHGPVLRYLALGASKLTGRHITPATGLRITRWDDRLPLPDRLGGSLAVLATAIPKQREN